MHITAPEVLPMYLDTAVYRKALVRNGFRGGPERASAFRNLVPWGVAMRDEGRWVKRGETEYEIEAALVAHANVQRDEEAPKITLRSCHSVGIQIVQ